MAGNTNGIAARDFVTCVLCFAVTRDGVIRGSWARSVVWLWDFAARRRRRAARRVGAGAVCGHIMLKKNARIRVNEKEEFKQKNSLSQHTGSTQVRTGAC